MSARFGVLERFDELINRGKALPLLSLMNSPSKDIAALEAWETACLHIVDLTFDEDSIYYEKLSDSFDDTNLEAQKNCGIAIMESAREEIEKGFLYEIKHLLVVDLFDSVLEQAEHLLENEFKDAAAILGRVIIENSLKAIAVKNKIELPEKIKLAELNTLLWKQEIYTKNIWRITQGHIDTGNFAAHGDFGKYDRKSVEDMLNWIGERLLSL